MKIDKYKRHQNGLGVADIFPLRTDKKCACGCMEKLTGRKTRWANEECKDRAVEKFWIIKGNGRVIRDALFEKDKGVCQGCGLICETMEEWQADHIIEVRHGGGGCTLDNFQTLCIPCHKEKTLSNQNDNTH